jgi:glutamate-1-semialdehyde 2,1-aminomutase
MNGEMHKSNNPYQWEYSDLDKRTISDLLDFLPPRVFDAHAHIYRVADLGLSDADANLWTGGGQEASILSWHEQVAPLFPSATLEGGLFFPAPLPRAEILSSNRYLMGELDQHPASRGLALVTPDLTPEDLDDVLAHPQVVGLKPYHVYSRKKPTPQSSISGFFPEHWWSWAHEHQGVVMMHIVKDDALMDQGNVDEIRRMCTEYPGMRLVLAHAGRSFHAPHAAGMKAICDLENVWFDMSGVCESAPMESVIEYFGPQKLLWGSDFPVSSLRGRAVTVGDGFFWMDLHSCDWNRSHGSPVLVGIESLRALRQACRRMSLNAADISDIFYGNVLRMLTLAPKGTNAGQDLYVMAKQRIPGGVQLLSKRPENMAPGHWPPYFSRAKGCTVWDLDGNRYEDFSTNAVGSCLLGYAHEAVNQAVMRRVQSGNMCSLNPPEEVALAEELCGIHPWAGQVRFVRGGGEACAVAVRIARATTGRSKVAVCGYHGWNDWYLAANLGGQDALKGHLLPGLEPAGVPDELRDTAFTFRYNDLEGFRKVMNQHGDELAAIVMEPCRGVEPSPGFLEEIRRETRRRGCLLVFDEITVGWRLGFGGAHLRYAVEPDMAVFAKALGNGYPIGAIIGTRAAMDGAHGSFISSTYWTESLGPVAALAVLQAMRETDVPGHVRRVGMQVQQAWLSHANPLGLRVKVGGFPSLATLSFDYPEGEMLRTIFTQQMLQRGFLAGAAFYPTLAHTDSVVNSYTVALGEVFEKMAKAIEAGNIWQLLQGEVAKSGFARLI